MNKKQILDIIKDAVLFNIETNIYKINDLNPDRIEFITETLLKIKEDSRTEVYINVKDIRVIKVKK